MISVKEYAKSRGVTIQAVHQQMSRKRNSEKLIGHVEFIDGVKYLDEEATAILDESRKKTPVIIIDDQKDEELESLRRRVFELEERVEKKDILIEKLQQRVEDKDKELIEARNNVILIEQKRDEYQEKVENLEKQHEKELEDQGTRHKQAIISLNNMHEAAMVAEKNRKLPISEAIRRVFGKKIVDDFVTNSSESLPEAPDQDEKQPSAGEL